MTGPTMKRITRCRIAAAAATLAVVAVTAWLWAGLSPARARVLGGMAAAGSVLGTFDYGAAPGPRLAPGVRILLALLGAGALAALFVVDLRDRGLAAAGTNAVAWAMMVAGNAAVLRCGRRSKK